ncbi:MAG: deoxyguanosinetriphosphate triphosphohydrolase [Thermoleophilia bacterium]|nr:deoxyguanosinetriphosphate triphosphohydrolase [Thermoleophilia bacterium]
MKREWPGKVALDLDVLEAGLSPWAQRSSTSRGRERPEEPCLLRSPYQRDRDRILHSKAFRRLKHKTQVFIAPEGDHYRTRLTHTLEVAGIARAIARALRLNEDLVEAIALGHDLGHTPFGHAGESVIDEILRNMGAGGFAHNEQSARVVELLENEGQGLNLTWEVRDGIRNHSGGCNPSTLEAKVVHLADRIAYVNHDIDDALRAGMLTYDDLPAGPLAILGATGSERIDALVHDVVDNSFGKPDIVQSPAVARALDELRDFLFQNVYPRALEEAGGDRIRLLITQLMEYFLDHPESLPPSVLMGEADTSGVPPLVRAVTDYVAGMTDRYAQRVYLELFMPKCWGNL